MLWRGPRSGQTGAGRWRTVGMSPAGWKPTCLAPARLSSVYRPDSWRAPAKAEGSPASRTPSMCRGLTRTVTELDGEIPRLVSQLAPTLMALAGCGGLSAAKIVGETAGVRRFRSKATFARWNGTAPIPVWSGNDRKFRLNRGGNRQVNAALHRIAITQCGGRGPGQAYVQSRIAAGDDKTEALRLLRRRLSDEVFRRLLIDAMQGDRVACEPAA